jgi:hypothetical protein
VKRHPLPRQPDDEKKLGTPEAAAFVGFKSPRTMENFRGRGGGPRYLVLSRRRVVYTKRAVREWLAERERGSTSDRGPRAA